MVRSAKTRSATGREIAAKTATTATTAADADDGSIQPEPVATSIASRAAANAIHTQKGWLR